MKTNMMQRSHINKGNDKWFVKSYKFTKRVSLTKLTPSRPVNISIKYRWEQYVTETVQAHCGVVLLYY